jgi:hypothetical protein
VTLSTVKPHLNLIKKDDSERAGQDTNARIGQDLQLRYKTSALDAQRKETYDS